MNCSWATFQPIRIQNLNFILLKAHPVPLYRTDTEAEIEEVCRIAEASGASAAVPCRHWERGGRGATDLAHAVKEAAAKKSNFHFLYDLQVNPTVCLFYTCLILGSAVKHNNQLIQLHGHVRICSTLT